MDGWIAGFGFAVVRADLRTELQSISLMRTKDGKKKFEFLEEHDRPQSVLNRSQPNVTGHRPAIWPKMRDQALPLRSTSKHLAYLDIE